MCIARVSASTRARIDAVVSRRISRGNDTLRRTLRWGNSAGAWKTMPIPRRPGSTVETS